MAEASAGKDSVTGHWEIAGLRLDRAFPTFPHGFPRDLIEAFERGIGRRTLGNVAASGTVILEVLGAEHLRTGAPIVYTSADSVFQIAAHEQIVPVDELYRMCRIAFDLACRGRGVARVIARPFVGAPGRFVRTANRRDFALEPPGPTLLDRLCAAGWPVVGIGKIEDLFAGRGLSLAVHTRSDADGMDAVDAELARTRTGLIFVNLVDFDSTFGHRNNAAGLRGEPGAVRRAAGTGARPRRAVDLVVVTADHGNDPTTPSTDHSREYVPVLAAGGRVRAGADLGTRSTFADLGQTVAEIFGVPALEHGTSFLGELLR